MYTAAGLSPRASGEVGGEPCLPALARNDNIYGVEFVALPAGQRSGRVSLAARPPTPFRSLVVFQPAAGCGSAQQRHLLQAAQAAVLVLPDALFGHFEPDGDFRQAFAAEDAFQHLPAPGW
jgi:hypothetical protein